MLIFTVFGLQIRKNWGIANPKELGTGGKRRLSWRSSKDSINNYHTKQREDTKHDAKE